MVAASNRGAPRHILVVEDDADLLNMLAKMLSPFGEVATASDGQEALDWLRGHPPPDLVVTDLMMPRVDGLTLARAIKQDSRTARVPIVMLTAKGQAPDLIAGINAGARHYVTKPFKQEELLGKVKRALGQE